MSDLLLAKEFARNGYKVFPLIKGSSKPYQPFGWSCSPVKEDKKHLVIEATSEDFLIDEWDMEIATKYKSIRAGYGVLGAGCVIIDVDDKDDRNGPANFQELFKTYGFPKCELVVKSKSGGVHYYFARPKAYAKKKVKTLVDVKVNGIEYTGVDIRGDGGYVRGPSRTGEWEEGEYVIIKGSPSATLSEAPEGFLAGIVATSKFHDAADDIIIPEDDPDDFRKLLRQGELPESIPAGARNESFYIFINALKSKGISRSAAKALANQLVERCEKQDDLHESVDIDDMISRVFEIDSNNPYDIASDIINRGFYQLANYRSGRIYYVLPNENPYLTSRRPHDAGSMRELMSKFSRTVVASTGREKLVNPMDLIIPRIPDEMKVDSLGFKPGSADIFSFGADIAGAKYLNVYRAPEITNGDSDLDFSIFENEFKVLVSRIFGEPGTDDYQLGLDFPAWLMQKPGIKMSIAPLLLSKVRGVGKSLYFNILHLILGNDKLGDQQSRMVKLDEIVGRFFNPTGVLLNMVDEVQFGLHRNVRQEFTLFWRHLKNLVTAETIPVEIKNGPTVQMPNTAGLIMAGNSDGFIPMEEMDRRIWIIDCQARELPTGVVDRLFHLVKATGPCANPHVRMRLIESLRKSLLNHQIKLDLESIRAPMTEIKMDMVRASRTDTDEWIHNYFEDGDNTLGARPIISHSSLLHILRTSDKILHESWRENAEILIREFKRRGTIVPIRRMIGATGKRKFNNIPVVLVTGDVAMAAKSEILYTFSNMTEVHDWSDDEIRKAFYVNLQTLKRRNAPSKSAISSSDLDSMIQSGNQ